MNMFVNNPISFDLETVPGIGEKSLPKLQEKGITMTQHLIAKYMSQAVLEEVEGTDGETTKVIDVFSTNQQFWHFLQDCGINSFRSGIVDAINRKVSSFDPSFTDNLSNYEG